MKPIQPKDHPTFKRAIGLAHKRMMEQRETLARRVAALLDEGGLSPKAAANMAMAELAHGAYREAVETLEQECSRRARVEYVIEGAVFLDEACSRMLAKGGELSSMIASALSLARAGMPGQVAIHLDFGLREDGLVFGTATHRAIGGSFQSLHDSVKESLELILPQDGLEQYDYEWDDSEQDHDARSSLSKDMRPALMAIVAQSLPPPDSSGEARPLSATIVDLRERLERLPLVDFQADAESRHVLTGLQAIGRIEAISAEAGSERPNAAEFSRFMMELGF